jgi:hypothetical protein
MTEEPLRALARKLACDFSVLVPLQGDVFRRRIIKLAYQEPIARRADYKQRTWGSRVRRGCAERLSWSPKTFAFSRIAVGDAEGHHVELVAPEDMEIVRASFSAYVPAGKELDAVGQIEVEQADVDVADALGTADVRPAGRQVLGESGNLLRAHMNLRRLPPQAYATARVQLRASPSGVLNAATFVAVLIVGVLWWGSHRTRQYPPGRGSDGHSARRANLARRVHRPSGRARARVGGAQRGATAHRRGRRPGQIAREARPADAYRAPEQPCCRRQRRPPQNRPYSDVVPSAAGGPLVTDLSPEEFRAKSKVVFRSAFDAIKRGVPVASY